MGTRYIKGLVVLVAVLHLNFAQIDVRPGKLVFRRLCAALLIEFRKSVKWVKFLYMYACVVSAQVIYLLIGLGYDVQSTQ